MRRRPGRVARLVAIGLLVSVVGIASPGSATPAHAATPPDSWCGPGPSSVDLPDTVVGEQFHVVYAHASDSPDRLGEVAPRIARDVAGVDTWWQTQDPTRTPRFDLADFVGCDSDFGRLDITSVPLPFPSASYNAADRVTLLTRVRADILAALGEEAVGKAYLVFLDSPVPAAGRICGATSIEQPATSFVFLQASFEGCSLDGLGSGTGFPAQTIAHELIHFLAGPYLTNPPHACSSDPAHVCDPSTDVMAVTPNISFRGLSDAQLDPGRDDYYGHGDPARRDARTSPWLEHLDASRHPLSVSVGTGGGSVASAIPGLTCPPRCAATWPVGSVVHLTAEPAPGFGFVAWAGDCQGARSPCVVAVDGDRFVLAIFAPLAPVELRVKGPGFIDYQVRSCLRACTVDQPRGTGFVVVARPQRNASFEGWSGDCHQDRAACTLVVGRRNRATATFTRR